VFYVTDRGHKLACDSHTGEESTDYTEQQNSFGLYYGSCPVQLKEAAVPADFALMLSEELIILRQVGAIGAEIYNLVSPVKVLAPNEFASTDTVSAQAQFFAALREASATKRERNFGTPRIVVLTPGFFHSLREGGMERGAILTHILRRLGYVVIVLSWSSKGTLMPDYWGDDQRVDDGVSRFAPFLVDLAQEFGAENIVLVQHSMGNKLMCQIMAMLVSEMGGAAPQFKRNFMVAPDVSLKRFQSEWINPVRACSLPMGTLILGSERDRLLPISEFIHAPLDQQVLLALQMLIPWIHAGTDPRLGEISKIPLLEGVKEVNYTESDDRLFGHGHLIPYVLIREFILAAMYGTSYGSQVERQYHVGDKLRHAVDLGALAHNCI
jgi:hypothetical protein